MFQRRNKFNRVKKEVDGVIFDSTAEADYYCELKLRQRAGELKIVALQPALLLTKANIKYIADFLIEIDGKMIHIDVKGVATQTFSMKKRLFKHYVDGELWVVKKKGNRFYVDERIEGNKDERD